MSCDNPSAIKSAEMVIKKGAELDLDIQTLALGGRGVAKCNGLVVFVEAALPGQRVKAKIFRKRKGFAEARILEVTKESPQAVVPRCAYFGECGGCRFQNLDYTAQLKYKGQQVEESLAHLGGFENPPVLETVPSPEQFYYRNKMESSFGDQRWLTRHELELDEITRPTNFALGLHARGRFDKILDIDACYLQSPRSVEILNCVRQFVLQSKIPPYSTRHHAGFWRHLVIREGKNTGETMINLVTAESPEGSKVVDELASQLSKQFQDITTIVHNINRKRAQVAIGDEERVLFGPGTIQERIGDCLFQISAHSFLQTNTKAAEFLYNKIVEFADFNGDETVYDLYSGAGTIALYCANKVEKVVGFEVLENAVKDAERNCHLNDVENCFFIQGDLKDAFELNSDNTAKSAPPNTIIMDPPRAGLHANVLNNVLNLHPEKMVYVSCNPATFARDAKELCTQQYQLNRVQPVDMFPMTSHIELVSLFTRNPR